MSVHMRTLEDNAQPLQRAGNQLMIKMVQRGNQRIHVKQKSHKMKNCLTQIQNSKLVRFKLCYSMSIQGPLPFFVKFLLLCKMLDILSYLEISKPYLDYHIINW